MPLPKKSLPSLDGILDEEHSQRKFPEYDYEEMDEAIELTEDDFNSESYYDEEPKEVIQEPRQREILDEGPSVPKEVFEESVQDKNKTSSEDKVSPLEKIKNVVSNRNKPNKKGSTKQNKKPSKIKINKWFVIGPILALLLLVITLTFLSSLNNNSNQSDSNQNSDKTETTTSEIKLDSTTIDGLTYKYKKGIAGGIVFDVQAENSTKINIQRLFKDENDNIVICESGDIEITKGQQEVFADCLNNRNEDDVKNSEDTLIADNIIEIKN